MKEKHPKWKNPLRALTKFHRFAVHGMTTVLENIRVSQVLPKEHEKKEEGNPSGNFHLGNSNVFVLVLGHQCRTVRAK